MIESGLQRIFIDKIYTRVSKIASERGFVNIDNGQMSGTHWVCLKKGNESYYTDSFGAPDNFLRK